MILDILTVLFFVSGFLLILIMIAKRRRDVLHGRYVTKEQDTDFERGVEDEGQNDRQRPSRSDAGIAGRYSDRRRSICYTHTERAGGLGPEDSRRGPRNGPRNTAELPGSRTGLDRLPS